MYPIGAARARSRQQQWPMLLHWQTRGPVIARSLVTASRPYNTGQARLLRSFLLATYTARRTSP